MSMYQESFSCKIAFVASAFLGVPFAKMSAFLSSDVGCGVRIISDLSLTISKVRGFSSWKFSSKYTPGMVDNGVTAWRLLKPLDLRLGWGESEPIEDTESSRDAEGLFDSLLRPRPINPEL